MVVKLGSYEHAPTPSKYESFQVELVDAGKKKEQAEIKKIIAENEAYVKRRDAERKAKAKRIAKAKRDAELKAQQDAQKVNQQDSLVKAIERKQVETRREKKSPPVKSKPKVASTGNYAGLANTYGSQYGIDPNWILAIIKTESNYDPNSVSSAGAVGLMQMLPGTAQHYGISRSQLFDPATNVEVCTRYLAELRDQLGSLRMATIAYNQGIGNVKNGTYKTWYYEKVNQNYQALKN